MHHGGAACGGLVDQRSAEVDHKAFGPWRCTVRAMLWCMACISIHGSWFMYIQLVAGMFFKMRFCCEYTYLEFYHMPCLVVCHIWIFFRKKIHEKIARSLTPASSSERRYHNSQCIFWERVQILHLAELWVYAWVYPRSMWNQIQWMHEWRVHQCGSTCIRIHKSKPIGICL